jgi:hypothetical protein
MTGAVSLQPLLEGAPATWHGLPPLPADAFDPVPGTPAAVDEADLGGLPAERRTYGNVTVWARDGAVVMVEIPCDLPASTLAGLEAPCAALPNELAIPGGYAREQLYCARGLVATIVKPHDGGEERIVRLRGIVPIADPQAFGPGLYQPFEDRVRWATPSRGEG